jgi:DHA1 family tetracycline resistance protein-like MFS transporter
MAGGYLAQSHTHYVFTCSLMLTLLDLLYIYFLLPESLEKTMPLSTSIELLFRKQNTTTGESNDYAWSPLQSVLFLLRDPFLRKVGEVALFYYTGVWAVISTLSLYAVQHFHLSPERLGELMSALGLCTMIAEAVLVRVIIPWVGEKKAIQFGLVSFALQCLVLGAATEPWHLFICVGFSLLGNLVYPSLSSLVSGIVDPESNGEALGAINGVKALTEGIGPLIFGALMTISEDSNFPGWPYWIASVFVLIAYQVAKDLPDTRTDDDTNDSDKEFIYELQFKQRRQQIIQNNNCVEFTTPPRDEDEYRLLLSEIEEESSDEEKFHTPYQDDAALTTPANKNRNQTENSEMLSTTDHGFPKPAFIQQQTEHSFVTNTPIIGGPHFAMKPEYPTILFSSTSAEKDDDFQKNKK